MHISSGLSNIAENYEYFIFDIWGVIHDGNQLYPTVLETLKYLKSKNKKICFLSNAPRRSARAEVVLNKFGIDKSYYDFILTSGESAFDDLKENQNNNFQRFGRNYLYIGPNKDMDLLDGLGYKMVLNPSQADFAITTGFDHDNSTLQEKLPLAIQANNYKLIMLCINPDLIVVKQNGQEMICAGLLGLEYEKMGGVVNYYGKPFKIVYDMVFEKYNNPPKSMFLAIGDSLETDIKGANDYGIDSLLLTGGILSNELGVKFWQDPAIENLNKLCNKYNIYPKHIISNLKL